MSNVTGAAMAQGAGVEGATAGRVVTRRVPLRSITGQKGVAAARQPGYPLSPVRLFSGQHAIRDCHAAKPVSRASKALSDKMLS